MQPHEHFIMQPEIPQKTPIVEIAQPGTYWWCTCGKSKSQPFCDGSHSGTAFSPEEVVIEKERNVAWCACKHSQCGAFCDGSHSSL
jgi:CDGSH-type Zn-finger protein